MLDNVVSSEQQRGLAARKSKPDEYKSVRHALVDEEISQGWLEIKKNKLNQSDQFLSSAARSQPARFAPASYVVWQKSISVFSGESEVRTAS